MKNIKDRIFKLFLFIALVWVPIALSFQVYIIYLNFTNQKQEVNKIVDRIEIVADKMR